LREIARDMLSLARSGLERRSRRDALGRDESRFLDPLDAIVASGEEPARLWLRRFEGEWNGSVEPAFREARI
jgi:glutamate--cysteine ligase